ncbi:RDD family protein [Flavobacterium sp. MAH-1]|uniref:RDD family protein n=1 Tax=Flavobacterium agri TaxID=2743471 RepID=A0A7Y9C7A1_9FLAO|nr:RDD family protein [Flavobacterium agri]NUY81214.1 RDD family protein [Flavobacterium agri]NYA71238.1 RDD family protein [Flavobacterium agri]
MTQISINTTQNVNIVFTAASVGDRILANIVDWLIKIAYFVVLFFMIFRWTGLLDAINKMDDWSGGAIIMIFMLPVAFYTLIFESWLEGQTWGKRLMKIKVVKIDGYQASFPEYLIRWFFRLVDLMIFNGLIAVISVSTSSRSQRLGDMAAGTSVITLKNKINISHTILEEIGTEYVPIYPLVIKLSDNDVRIIKETFNNAVARNDYDTVRKLVDKVEKVTGIRNQSGNHHDFIRTVIKDYNFYTRGA